MPCRSLPHAPWRSCPRAVTLDFPFGRPLNALVAAAGRAAERAGLDTSWLDRWRRARLVLLDAGMAMRLSEDDQRNM